MTIVILCSCRSLRCLHCSLVVSDLLLLSASLSLDGTTETHRQPQQTEKQKTAIMFSHDALSLSEPHLSFQHRCRPT